MLYSSLVILAMASGESALDLTHSSATKALSHGLNTANTAMLKAKNSGLAWRFYFIFKHKEPGYVI